MGEVMLLQMDADRLILEDLAVNGRNIAANVADNIDYHRKSVTPRLRQLEDYGLVDNVGRGVYEITEMGEAAVEILDAHKGEDVDDWGEVVEQELRERGFEPD